MRFGFLILAAGLLVGCQPSVEEQAKREMAVEAEKQKIRNIENLSKSAEDALEKEAFHFWYGLRSELRKTDTQEAKDKLSILEVCINTKHDSNRAIKICYQDSISK